MTKEILSEDKEAENNRERVKKLHKSCKKLLRKFGDTPLKPDGSYIITPIKKIGKNLSIRLSTDSILGGTLNREEALDGPLFVYIYRKNTKENSEHIMLVGLKANGECKIDSFIEKNERFYGEKITLSKSQVLRNCERFIASFQHPT